MRKGFQLVTGSPLAQESVRNTDSQKAIAAGIDAKEIALARCAAAEGCVLLKNIGHTLPLLKEEEVAVFGRCQRDYFYVGYGSGGDVNPPYLISLMDGLDQCGASYDKKLAEIYRTFCENPKYAADPGWWGHWPMSHPEMPVTPEMVRGAAAPGKKALVVIGRAAGEDRENTLTQGSYYLTDEEIRLLDQVTSAFASVIVVLNIGNIMDMSWTAKYGDKISSILIAWQGGMESGNALCDVLYGTVNPCGRLSDTIANNYEDYNTAENFGGKEFNDYKEGIFVGYRYFASNAKDKILYPFGFGLSYTSFKTEVLAFEKPTSASVDKDTFIRVRVKVTNTGELPGKDVVLLWCRQAEGRLEKASFILAGFSKTKMLQPGETDEIDLETSIGYISSYDEEKSAFLLEEGIYSFFVNDDGIDEIKAGSWTVAAELITEQCEQAMTKEVDLKQRILDRMPQESTDPLLLSLSDKELEAMTRGHGMMNSVLGAKGNAGVFGGILESLREKGIRPIICADGPAGIRLSADCALLPCGTAQACSFNTQLIEDLYAQVGNEMAKNGVDVLLGPGMNIHRNPLCGRNFEYFSEDPLLSGKMGAAVVRGVQQSGRAACPKHFACNNQETHRNINDARVSERALREIYLRNFEICVREAAPKVIMTSYNKINGVWSHYNYDLVTTVLRGQWGFDGVVITDWWMKRSKSPEFPQLEDNAYRVRAQVDILMPGAITHVERNYVSDGSLLKTLGQKEGIKKAELFRTAESVLRLLKRLP